MSQYHRLTDEQIIEAVSCTGKSLRGARWDDTTRFAVLDIDAESKYHNIEGLKLLRNSLRRAGINNTKLYQSSISGGWHLYIFFDAFSNSDQINRLLKQWLHADGFEIKGGVLEIFPSGNGLRLPLQYGFAWLDDNGAITLLRNHVTTEEALDLFLLDLAGHSNDWEAAAEVIQLRLSAIEKQNKESDEGEMAEFDLMVQDATKKLDQDRWNRGRTYWINGLTEANQRHEAILYVGYYLWFGDSTLGMSALRGRRCASQRERLIRQWLTEKHNGYSGHIKNKNWQKVEDDIKRAVNWRRSLAAVERVPYLMTERLVERLVEVRTLTVDDFRKANEKREFLARRQIEKAVYLLDIANKKVTQKAVQRLTGCSINTIRRHKDLLMSKGSGDLSPGGGGVVETLGDVLDFRVPFESSIGLTGSIAAEEEREFEVAATESESQVSARGTVYPWPQEAGSPDFDQFGSLVVGGPALPRMTERVGRPPPGS